MPNQGPDPKWISENTAKTWAKNYQEWVDKPGPKNPKEFLRHITFQKEDIERVLAQPGAAGLRVNFGYHHDNHDKGLPQVTPGEKVFISATNREGRPIEGPEALTLDLGVGCPPDCDPPVGGGG